MLRQIEKKGERKWAEKGGREDDKRPGDLIRLCQTRTVLKSADTCGSPVGPPWAMSSSGADLRTLAPSQARFSRNSGVSSSKQLEDLVRS
eukprot:5427321-Amphidinium_carterae.3